MKALLISDIHGSYRFLSQIYEKFSKEPDVRAILFAGDLVDMGEPVSFVDEFLWTVQQLDYELIWVPGNNDFGRAYHRLNARCKSVEGVVHEFAGRKFTGVGGSPASWSGQYQGERSVDKKAIAGTIFISHVPPPGINSFKKTDEAISEQPLPLSNHRITLSDAPLVHLCGHIHHTWGAGNLGTTKVVKLAAAYLGYCAIMDLDTLEVKFERLWK